MSSTTIETVPAEISIHILCQLSSPESLYALIRASRHYYLIFNASKAKVLSDVIQTCISPEALPDAKAAAAASLNDPRGPDVKTVVTIMSAYRRHKDNSIPYAILPVTTSTQICRLYLSVECHIQVSEHHALTALDQCGSSPVYKSWETYSAEQQLLSFNEKTRLQRAFYSLELFSALFYSDHRSKKRQLKIPAGKQ